MKYNYILAWLIGAITALGTVSAVPTAKKDALSTLEVSLPKLARLAKRLDDRQKQVELETLVQYGTRLLESKKKIKDEAILQTAEKVKMAMKHFHGHDDSDSIYSDLSDLDSEIDHCCHHVLCRLRELIEILEEASPCDAAIAIDEVPYIIETPGKYCVTRDLSYTGENAAITVHADNVTINFHNHSLTLTNPDAQGILVQNVAEFTLLDDVIQAPSIVHSTLSAAVVLENVRKATLDNVYTLNTTKGVYINNSVDVLLKNCLLREHEGTLDDIPSTAGIGALIYQSRGVTIDNCTFDRHDSEENEGFNGFAIQIEGDSQNVNVFNSTMTNMDSSILARQVTGLTVDGVLAKASPFTRGNLMQIGSARSDDFLANNVIIKNSSFIQDYFNLDFVGLYFIQGDTCLIDNVTVQTSSGSEEGFFTAAVLVGCRYCDPERSYNNIFANNLVVTGNNDVGLLIESGTKNVFTNSTFTNAGYANVYFSGYGELQGALYCAVKDSLIADAGVDEGPSYGVLMENSYINSVENCEVIGNKGWGIYLNNISYANHIKNNNVYGNGVGIENNGSSTETFLNSSCGNIFTNCINVSPALQPSDPQVVGSNICCIID